MPRGDKSAYTDKQKRQAEHIEKGYEKSGVSEKEAEARAWATVNKESGGGKKSGSGRVKKESHASSRKGGRIGGRAAASRPAAARSRSAKNAGDQETQRQKEKPLARARLSLLIRGDETLILRCDAHASRHRLEGRADLARVDRVRASRLRVPRSASA